MTPSRGECLRVVVGVDLHGHRPGESAVRGMRHRDAVALPPRKARVLPDDVDDAPGADTHGHQTGAVAHHCVGVRIAGADGLQIGDGDRSGPGGAVIGGLHRPHPRRARPEFGENVDHHGARQHDDLVADGLALRTRIVDAAGELPGGAGAGRHGKVARPGRLPGEPVPHRVHIIRIGRVGGDRALVIEELRAVLNERDRRTPAEAAVAPVKDNDRA